MLRLGDGRARQGTVYNERLSECIGKRCASLSPSRQGTDHTCFGSEALAQDTRGTSRPDKRRSSFARLASLRRARLCIHRHHPQPLDSRPRNFRSLRLPRPPRHLGEDRFAVINRRCSSPSFIASIHPRIL